MSFGARNWTFLHVHRSTVLDGRARRGHQQIGLATQEGWNLQYIAHLRHGFALLGFVHVRQHGNRVLVLDAL
jgi:hypothetical protein